MKVVTFYYSYKGGVGRTLAATNFAVYLAKLGLKVLIIDFDLDAPGVDSKFSTYELPTGQLGLLDFVLKFQRDGAPPGPIEPYVCKVPIASPRQEYALWMIPAGDYLAEEYSAKLNELDWATLFSEDRNGVAFFQLFLKRIEETLNPDAVVIDSRTGFSEIGGLCTQQLAHETVIITSLARESVKMTRHLAKVIRESEIAKSLNREVETKIVVSRFPKQRDIHKLKARYCKVFEIDETKLFFLFSCPGLEREEFVAMLDPSKDESLAAGYIQLFQGLNVEIAQQSIKEEIDRTESGLLSSSPEEAEARIRELVALYPHPEVYRRAMRFFNLTRRPDDASVFGLRLLDLVPDDAEAEGQVTRSLLRRDAAARQQWCRESSRPESLVDVERVLGLAVRAYRRGDLRPAEELRLADLLEDVRDYPTSLEIATAFLDKTSNEDSEMRRGATEIAVRTAMQLDKKDIASKLVAGIPVTDLRGRVANVAIQLKLDGGDRGGAFELAKLVLARDLSHPVLRLAAELAQELGRRKELEEVIRNSSDSIGRNPEIIWEIERLGIDVSELQERVPGRRGSRFRR